MISASLRLLWSKVASHTEDLHHVDHADHAGSHRSHRPAAPPCCVISVLHTPRATSLPSARSSAGPVDPTARVGEGRAVARSPRSCPHLTARQSAPPFSGQPRALPGNRGFAGKAADAPGTVARPRAHRGIASRVGTRLVLATPSAFRPSRHVVDGFRSFAFAQRGIVERTHPF